MRGDVAELAVNSVESGEFKTFGDALAVQSLPESFAILLDHKLTNILAAQLGGNVSEWVVRETTWNSDLYNPVATFSPAEQILHLLWQDLRTKLARKLDAVARRTSIAPQGAILCFFGRSELSIVVEYKKSAGGAMDLRPLIAPNEPTGILELTSLLDGATPAFRNAIKKVAISVDKLVFQRGSIVHVNRQHEEVFGPTIDTIILGELVAEWLDNSLWSDKNDVLEVGPGSGLVSVILASSDHVRELTAVDLNMAAAICTLKNLQINDIVLDAKHQTVRVRAERFSADHLSCRFDLIVCNPPYIPDTARSKMLYLTEYDRAVGGLVLCREILASLPNILADRGHLLLMTSSVSGREIIELIPTGFEFIPAFSNSGRRVPLDVDVLWRSSEWQRQLVEDGRIEEDSNGALWHYLRPLWIRRRRMQGTPDV